MHRSTKMPFSPFYQEVRCIGSNQFGSAIISNTLHVLYEFTQPRLSVDYGGAGRGGGGALEEVVQNMTVEENMTMIDQWAVEGELVRLNCFLGDAGELNDQFY